MIAAGTISDSVAFDVAGGEYFDPVTFATMDDTRGRLLADSEIKLGFTVIGVNDTEEYYAATDKNPPASGHQVPDVHVSVPPSNLLPWLVIAGLLFLASK